MDLLDKIKAGVSATKEITWPNTDAKIKIRVANEQDHLEAGQSTDKIFEGIKIGIENVDKYNAEMETQLFYRIISNPETNKPICKTISEFRSLLSPEIKDGLADEIDSFLEEYSPSVNNLSQEELDNIIDNLKKKSDETVMNISNISIARKVITTLVSMVMNLHQDNGFT